MKCTVALLLSLITIPVAAQHGPQNERPAHAYTLTPVSAREAEAWRADLAALVQELERNHPAPYNHTPRDVFAAAVARLDARIPTLPAHQIIVEFERLLALVGDGHTNLNLASGQGVDFHQLPVRFGLYEDGIWIEAADRRYADAVGARVIAIGGVAADSALARLTPLVSRDNPQWIQTALPHLLNLIEVLHALQLSSSLDRATLVIEKNGQRRHVDVTPLPQTRPRPMFYPILPQLTHDWVEASDQAAAPLPLFRQRLDDVYWFEYLRDQRLLYIKWDQVMNRGSGESALQMFRQALTFARENASGIDRVLLDIRNNTGGEGGLLDPIVREIVRTREVDELGRFFIAIGPRTFSAATMFTAQLERYARPIFVGEPTGGKLNGYGGHVFVTLPNSGLGVAISPDYYQNSFPRDPRMYVTPRLYVRPTFADVAANRDPVLEAVLAYRGEVLAPEVQELVARGDTAQAEQRVRQFAAQPINRFHAATAPLNGLGYQLLNGGQVEDALRVFRLNVRVHPQYANGWDSLGEAYERAGQIEAAIAAFERVLQLEPHNPRAREFIQRLKARQAERGKRG